MATITDVASSAGVSVATVSRVINTPSQVSQKAREAVERAIQQLNYRPNRAARALKRQESQTVGVVLNRFSSPYFGSLLEAVEQSLFELQFKTIAESGRETEEAQIAACLSLIERQCESFIVHSDAVSETRLRALMEDYPTLVLINRVLPGFEERCIALDNVAAGRMAARHLVENGHRDIAVLTGPTHLEEIRDRQDGFVAGLSEAGVTLAPELIAHGWFTDAEAEEVVADLVGAGRPFTAVFAHNDIMAAGAMEALRRAGLTVPDHVSVLGFDDLDLARFVTPKLSTIRQPVHRIGTAAGLLAYQLARPKDPVLAAQPVQRAFQAELIPRASVRNIKT